MKNAMIKGLTATLLVLALAGCATTSKKSPEEMIQASVEGWKTALVANDLDKVMTYYSDNFTHYEYKDKAGMKTFLEGVKNQGYLTGIKASSDKMKITVDKDKATAYPIDLTSSAGSVTIELKYGKEKNGWMIIGSDASGV